MNDEFAAAGPVRCVHHEVIAAFADFERVDLILQGLDLRIDVDADEEGADDSPGRIADGLVLGDVQARSMQAFIVNGI